MFVGTCFRKNVKNFSCVPGIVIGFISGMIAPTAKDPATDDQQCRGDPLLT